MTRETNSNGLDLVSMDGADSAEEGELEVEEGEIEDAAEEGEIHGAPPVPARYELLLLVV